MLKKLLKYEKDKEKGKEFKKLAKCPDKLGSKPGMMKKSGRGK